MAKSVALVNMQGRGSLGMNIRDGLPQLLQGHI